MDQKKASPSLLQLYQAGRKIVDLMNDKYEKKYSIYTYSGKSENNIAKIKINKHMNLNDKYELKICMVKSKNKNICITCNASNFSSVYDSDMFTYIENELIYDLISPIPETLIFKSNDNFEILIQLRDK